LRYEGQQVYCMEATSGSGVGLFKWGKWFKLYFLKSGWRLTIGMNTMNGTKN
jgi:hypothetical protein